VDISSWNPFENIEKDIITRIFKGGLISDRFSDGLKFPKKRCQITLLSIFSLGGYWPGEGLWHSASISVELMAFSHVQCNRFLSAKNSFLASKGKETSSKKHKWRWTRYPGGYKQYLLYISSGYLLFTSNFWHKLRSMHYGLWHLFWRFEPK
jgi:hypothetical protein